ncbi:MAG: hypothetical protein WCJ35_11155 [Planctomycetota bacterium]
MSTDGFNEAERYLVQNWRQARRVEESMADVRPKYVEIGDRILETVQENHPELNWSENSLKRYPCIHIGRKKWQQGDDHGCIGIEYISLDELTAEHPDDEPFIGIWTGEQKKPLTDFKGIKRIEAAAKKLLAPEEIDRWEWPDELNQYQYQFSYYLPEKRTKLLDMILKDDGQEFVDCLVKHFESFVRFIPVLDEVFAKPSAKPGKK